MSRRFKMKKVKAAANKAVEQYMLKQPGVVFIYPNLANNSIVIGLTAEAKTSIRETEVDGVPIEFVISSELYLLAKQNGVYDGPPTARASQALFYRKTNRISGGGS